MIGFDQMTNVVLSDAEERVFALDQGVTVLSVGTYVLRGDNMYGSPIPIPISFSLVVLYPLLFFSILPTLLMLLPYPCSPTSSLLLILVTHIRFLQCDCWLGGQRTRRLA